MLKSIRHGIIAGLTALALVGIGLKAADLGNAIYSETDASNNASTLFPEGMAPSAVNDNMRGLIGALYRWYNHSQATTASTGSANAYVLTYAVTPAAYATGDVYSFRASFTNSGSASININGLGARSITRGAGNAPLQADDIRGGQIVSLSYDPNTGTFQLISPAGGGQFANPATSGGSSNAYTVILSPTPTQYITGMNFSFRAAFSNTSSASINVNGLGARTISKSAGATALQTDDIRAGQQVELTYDPVTGTFQLQSPAGGDVGENGSWTPTIRGSGTAGTMTYSVQAGRYVRVGDLVNIWARVVLTATDANATSNIQIAGLPYTSSTVTSMIYACEVGNYEGIATDTSSPSYTQNAFYQVGANIASNSAVVAIFRNRGRGSAGGVPVTAMEAAVDISVHCTYRIN